MTDSSQYAYKSPLHGYEHLPPLSDERNDDGKNFVNPKTNVLSKAYEEFVDPIENGIKGGWRGNQCWLAVESIDGCS